MSDFKGKKTGTTDVADTVAAGAIEGAGAALDAGGDARDVAAAAIGGAAAGTAEAEVDEKPAPVFLDKGAEEARIAAAEPAVEPTPTPEEVAALETPVRTTFQDWVTKCIHNSPLSEHTASYNYLLSQLPELEAMLKKDDAA